MNNPHLSQKISRGAMLLVFCALLFSSGMQVLEAGHFHDHSDQTAVECPLCKSGGDSTQPVSSAVPPVVVVAQARSTAEIIDAPQQRGVKLPPVRGPPALS